MERQENRYKHDHKRVTLLYCNLLVRKGMLVKRFHLDRLINIFHPGNTFSWKKRHNYSSTGLTSLSLTSLDKVDRGNDALYEIRDNVQILFLLLTAI